MTKIDDVVMLDMDTPLNLDTLHVLLSNGLRRAGSPRASRLMGRLLCSKEESFRRALSLTRHEPNPGIRGSAQKAASRLNDCAHTQTLTSRALRCSGCTPVRV